jgi:curved DNA-binding protein CbpA
LESTVPKVSGISPTAHGSLEKTPFAHLLVYIAERQMTGTIVLSEPSNAQGDERMVFFSGGAVCAVGGGRNPASDIAQCFELPDTTGFAFYQDVNFLSPGDGAELARLDVLATIWSAVRARGVDRNVDATLVRLGATLLKLHEQSEVARFGFGEDELAVVQALKLRPRPLLALLSSGLLPPPAIKTIVYALLITRHLDHGSALPVGLPSPDDRDGASPDANPGSAGKVAIARVKLASRRADSVVEERAQSLNGPALSAELLQRKQAIIQRAEAIDREDFFAMLEISKDATPAEIEVTYYRLAKTWHPDRLPPELASVREDASKVFARMNEAFHTLADEPRRKRYLDVLKGGGGTPEEANQIQQIVDAATDFQRGEILWRNRDPAAEKFIMRAYRAEPKQGDYAALFVLLELSKRPPDAAVDDLLKLCDAAIESNDRCERAYFCRGLIKKRIGKIETSIADFRKAFDLNPKNLDAGREVRLYEMRRPKQGERRSTPAPRRSVPPGAQTKSSNPPRSNGPARSKPPTKAESNRPKKEGGMLSGIGKLFKR